jgi:hypothetical protein
MSVNARFLRQVVAEDPRHGGGWYRGVPSPVLGESVEDDGGVRAAGSAGGLVGATMVEGWYRARFIKRNARPHLSWLVEHLPDVVLFAVAVPVSLLSLLLHFV